MKQPMQIDKNTMNDNLKINYKCGKYINFDAVEKQMYPLFGEEFPEERIMCAIVDYIYHRFSF